MEERCEEGAVQDRMTAGSGSWWAGCVEQGTARNAGVAAGASEGGRPGRGRREEGRGQTGQMQKR